MFMASKLIIYTGENPYSGEKLLRDYILTLYLETRVHGFETHYLYWKKSLQR